MHVLVVSALRLGTSGVARGGEPINFYLLVSKEARNDILIMSNSGSLFPALCTPWIHDECLSRCSGSAWVQVWSGDVFGGSLPLGSLLQFRSKQAGGWGFTAASFGLTQQP